MDRVFSNEDQTIEAVQVHVEPPTSTPTPRAAKNQDRSLTWPQVCLAAVGMMALLGSAGLTLHWRHSQQTLERDRNLALIEQLQRQPSPATDATTVASPPNDGELSEGSSSDAASDPELAQSGLTITPCRAPCRRNWNRSRFPFQRRRSHHRWRPSLYPSPLNHCWSASSTAATAADRPFFNSETSRSRPSRANPLATAAGPCAASAPMAL